MTNQATTTNPMALVTGASSGIGRALATVLAQHGYDVTLVARREPELRALADDLSAKHGVSATVVTADLAVTGAAQRLYDQVNATGRGVDVLVNNAGIAGHGRFTTTDLESAQRTLAINVVALTELSRLFLPAMVERGTGRLLNVASTAAFQPGPFMAVYYASKAYVLSLTEALAKELDGTGVTATALCPGVVPTEIFDAGGMSPDLPLLKSPGTKSADYVAAAAYRGMVRGAPIVIPGLYNQAGAQLNRVLPRRAVLEIVKRLHPPS
jgi:hypothetical protein